MCSSIQVLAVHMMYDTFLRPWLKQNHLSETDSSTNIQLR